MLRDYVETINHCLKCGACKTAFGPFMPICPSGLKFGFESHYAVGRIEIAKAVIDGRLQLNANLMKRIYTCTDCGGCDEQCGPNIGVFPMRIIEEIKYEAIEKGLIPPEVRDFLKNIGRHGNPYLETAENRAKWADDLGVETYSDQEFLFYVGCVGSYDERGKSMARALAGLLLKAGVSFGILGSGEVCDGNEVNKVGEKGLFEYLAKENIRTFQERGVKKIFTLSPHSFNALKNDYPRLGMTAEPLHYTQLLSQLLDSGVISPKKEMGKRVTFHDPCFLGRHNGDYESARAVLGAIPGLELIEMEMNRHNAFCCGGGGGNFFTDMLGGGPRSPARVRIRQSLETGAEMVAVACPNCARMLDDAANAEGVEDKIVVKDIAEILEEVC
ncbi:MAG: (Fe-S)-binding protein [Deltaproteobacteria bacterium]|nr:(Fe-S)-binding protein [Deltaproteobacteria bacterium]MBW2120223.1 (Fe-S)-binding protein [Deltaproteobacteria bacterium]